MWCSSVSFDRIVVQGLRNRWWCSNRFAYISAIFSIVCGPNICDWNWKVFRFFCQQIFEIEFSNYFVNHPEFLSWCKYRRPLVRLNFLSLRTQTSTAFFLKAYLWCFVTFFKVGSQEIPFLLILICLQQKSFILCFDIPKKYRTLHFRAFATFKSNSYYSLLQKNYLKFLWIVTLF